MILRMNTGDISILLSSLAMTRKNVRNGFKSKYGKKQGKELLASFDEVKKEMESVLERIEENEFETVDVNELHTFHFNINEIDMIHSFLHWYVPQLEDVLDEATKGNISELDQHQLETLKRTRDKVDMLKEVTTVV